MERNPVETPVIYKSPTHQDKEDSEPIAAKKFHSLKVLIGTDIDEYLASRQEGVRTP